MTAAPGDEVLLSSSIPVEVIVRGRRCVVVGAGGEVSGKVTRLVAAGAEVTLFASAGSLDEQVRAHVASGDVTLVETPCSAEDLQGAAVVFIATDHEALGAQVFAEAAASGRLVCTLDRPACSTFINPAVAEGAGLRISLSSGGAAPSLLRRLREDLEVALRDADLCRFVRVLTERRRALPRGERAGAMRALTADFGIELRFRWPAWFAQDADAKQRR